MPDLPYSTTLRYPLLTALQLRELSGDKVKMSDTLNSLGTLKQRQHEYAEAERHYTHSLEVHPIDTP